MYTLLVVILLFALLFDTAAATSPAIDPTLPVPPMETFYPDPEGMLTAICDLCQIPFNICGHGPTSPQQLALDWTPEIFLAHPEWPPEPQPTFAVLDILDEPEPEPEPPFSFVAEADRQPLRNEVVRQLNDNATTIQPSTVQIHVECTYTPGDRVRAARAGSRRPSHRRQPPLKGGFPCTSMGCGKTFDRSCDLKRHQKTHMDRSERPHKCSVCHEGFLYPKDRNRHQRTHDQSSSTHPVLYCRVLNCPNVDGFSRKDNLLRHQRKQHPHLFA